MALKPWVFLACRNSGPVGRRVGKVQVAREGAGFSGTTIVASSHRRFVANVPDLRNPAMHVEHRVAIFTSCLDVSCGTSRSPSIELCGGGDIAFSVRR